MYVGIVGDGTWSGALAKNMGMISQRRFAQLLRNPIVDAVALEPPIDHRVAWATQAARAGKNVMLLGPLGRSAHEAEIALAAVKEAGTKICVVYHRRFDPAFQQATAQLHTEKIGKPGFFKIHGDYSFTNTKGDGGLLWGDLIHDLDWIQAELGSVKSVFAQGVTRGGKHPLEYAMITLTLRSGVIGQVIGSRQLDAVPRIRLEICGTAGMIQLDTGEHPIEVRVDGKSAVSPVANSVVKQQWAAFETLLESRSTGIAEAKKSLIALRIAEAVQQSIDSGKPVAVKKG